MVLKWLAILTIMLESFGFSSMHNVGFFETYFCWLAIYHTLCFNFPYRHIFLPTIGLFSIIYPAGNLNH
jgi:hypothetical protein